MLSSKNLIILNLLVKRQNPKIIDDTGSIVWDLLSKLNSLFKTCVIEYPKKAIYPKMLKVQINKNNISVCSINEFSLIRLVIKYIVLKLLDVDTPFVTEAGKRDNIDITDKIISIIFTIKEIHMIDLKSFFLFKFGKIKKYIQKKLSIKIFCSPNINVVS